jgi:putative PIN family toxin of toxin-antitoxin system
MKKINRLKVVLDTNVLLVSIPPLSQYRIIFDKFLSGSYDLCISNEILTEYEEILMQRYDNETVDDLFKVLLFHPNVIKVTPYYHWNLIVNDPDDNKFVDTAIASNANLIVTNDKHFNVLKHIDFPFINFCKAEDFREFLLQTSECLL